MSKNFKKCQPFQDNVLTVSKICQNQIKIYKRMQKGQRNIEKHQLSEGFKICQTNIQKWQKLEGH